MSVTLKDVGSGFKRTAINQNFTDIESEINNNLLNKDGSIGLEADLDFNSNSGINISSLHSQSLYLQGQLVTAEDLSAVDASRVFATIAEMKASTGMVDGMHLITQGYSAAGDGGGGEWVYDGTNGVHGNAIITSGGTGYPDGEYKVNLAGDGTGATAMVVVDSGVVTGARILEPGTGYTSAPSLSWAVSDWNIAHDNEPSNPTFSGSEVAGDVTFDLADDILYTRLANGAEFKRNNYEGVLNVKWAGATGDGTTDDHTACTNAVLALLRGQGQSILEITGGGGGGAGGTLFFPAGIYFLNDKRLYINNFASEHGTEAVAVTVKGVAKGSARFTRPDPFPAGTRIIRGIITFGYVNTPDGVFDNVSRGIAIRDMEIIGGLEFFAVQHAPYLENIRVVPSFPVGSDSGGIQTNGAGIYAKYCSTFCMNSVLVTSGDRVEFGDNFELDGIWIQDCNHVVMNQCLVSFNIEGVKFLTDPSNRRSTTFIANGLLLEANNETSLDLVAVTTATITCQIIGRGTRNSSVPMVRVGSPSFQAFAVHFQGCSIDGALYDSGTYPDAGTGIELVNVKTVVIDGACRLTNLEDAVDRQASADNVLVLGCEFAGNTQDVKKAAGSTDAQHYGLVVAKDYTIRGIDSTDVERELIKVNTSNDKVYVGNPDQNMNVYADSEINLTTGVKLAGTLNHDGTTAGFYGNTPIIRQSVTGSAGGNAALQSLLSALDSLGLITDSST